MKLEIRPEAAKAFNERANDLLPRLICKLPRPKSPRKIFRPEVFIHATLTKADIINVIGFEETDELGNPAKWFKHEGIVLGLYGENYLDLLRLAEQMQRMPGFSRFVSAKTVFEMIFQWIRDKYRKNTQLSMTEYVVQECEHSIKESEIWIPISLLHIQSEFRIGEIVFRTITKDIIDRWCQKSQELAPHQKEEIQQAFDNDRKKIQGSAAVTLTITADLQRAEEIAFDVCDRAVSFLRVFSPANFSAQASSQCALMGKEHIESYRYILIDNEAVTTVSSGLLESARPWIITDEFLSIIKPTLDILSERLIYNKNTEFQEKVLDALLLYSKSALMKDPSDKLVYILVALEFIFLRNENEPIMQNMGERMAFFIGRNPKERKLIIKIVKKVYGLRSAFIHHGQTVGDVSVLERFMFYAWKWFQNLILNLNKFGTKIDFINAIEEVKLS